MKGSKKRPGPRKPTEPSQALSPVAPTTLEGDSEQRFPVRPDRLILRAGQAVFDGTGPGNQLASVRAEVLGIEVQAREALEAKVDALFREAEERRIGEAAVVKHQAKEKEERAEAAALRKARHERDADIRGWITLGIAVLALVISFVTLLRK